MSNAWASRDSHNWHKPSRGDNDEGLICNDSHSGSRWSKEEIIDEKESNGKCSICGVSLDYENNQPFDSISQVVWARPGVPETQVLKFCKYCIERRKLGLIRGLEQYKEDL
jgi:hypothetical protein